MNPRVPSTHTTHAGQVGKVGDRDGWQIVPERFMGLGETGFEIWTFPNFLLSPGLPTRCCLYLEHPSPLSGAVIPGHPLGLSSDISSSGDFLLLPQAGLGDLPLCSHNSLVPPMLSPIPGPL